MSLDDLFDDIEDKKNKNTEERTEKVDDEQDEASTSQASSKDTSRQMSEELEATQRQAKGNKDDSNTAESSEIDKLFSGGGAGLEELDVEKLFTRKKRRKRRKINWVQVIEVAFIIWLFAMGTLTIYTSALDRALTNQTSIATQNLDTGLNYLTNSNFLLANESFYSAYLNFTSARKLLDTIEFYTRINIAYQAYLLVNPELVSGLALRNTFISSGIYVALSGVSIATSFLSYKTAIISVSRSNKNFTSALDHLNSSRELSFLSTNYLNTSKNHLVLLSSYTLNSELAMQLNVTQRVNSIMTGLSYDLIVISNLTYYAISFYHELYRSITALENENFQQALNLATSTKSGVLDLLSDLNRTTLYYLKNHGIAVAAALSYLLLAAKSVEDGANLQQTDPFVILATGNVTYVDYELNLLVGD
ncbi:MAG: hypothetical protein J7L47_03070 [Candidatus Odinarchaeota archaeon]|nr:hypothetical protein [Candidatus Odinarchaeota archaeon]